MEKNLGVLNKKGLTGSATFSTFDNTCPHVKFFQKPLLSQRHTFVLRLYVNLSGQREWSNLYSFIESIRIPETLDYYLKYGLPIQKYLYCKNYSLKNFLPALLKIIIKGNKGGLSFIKIKSHILRNMIFPNFYLSPLIYLFNKIFKNNI